MRKLVFRRTVDYNSSIALFIEQRTWKRKFSHRPVIQSDIMYQHLLTPPTDYKDNPMNCVCTKHVRTSTNKNKCPIYAVCWTGDGRRLITGSQNGEFTIWNGLTFNFETILQAHDTKIRAMKWSHNEDWLISTDDSGFVKYWQSNLLDVNIFQAHKSSVKGVSFSPSDKKFATCSDDNTVRIWDFDTYKEERVLRGHGREVRCISWHPMKSLLLSGSKDSQQPLKFWDPKSGQCLSTLYIQKNPCTDIKINKNGNWFLTASNETTFIKLFDIRNLKTEMHVFQSHRNNVTQVEWHPFHETLFASGSVDGTLLYWLVDTNMEVGTVENAHDNIIWSLDWHPIGHILVSGSNDFTTKFWTRNQPGDILNENFEEEKNTADKRNSGIVDEPYLNSFIDIEMENTAWKSEIQNEFDKSDIPGLSEVLNKTNFENDTNSNYDDSEESKTKNRTISMQFQSNWDNINSTSLVKTTSNNQPITIVPPTVPPKHLIPQFNIPTSATVNTGPVCSNLNTNKRLPLPFPIIRPPNFNLQIQQQFPLNPAFQFMKPPINTASTLNFFPRNPQQFIPPQSIICQNSFQQSHVYQQPFR